MKEIKKEKERKKERKKEGKKERKKENPMCAQAFRRAFLKKTCVSAGFFQNAT